MDQIHFHWASEHTINSRRYGLEMHIVSHEKRFPNFTIALQNRRAVSVLGVLFHVDDDENQFLKNILDAAEEIKGSVGGSSKLKAPFRPDQLLPKSRMNYFRYEGSLTTPGCDESIIWTILKDSLPIASDQIERFQQIKNSHGTLLTHNFRPLQRLNSRPLIHVQNDDLKLRSNAQQTTVATALIGMALIALQIARKL